MIAYKAFDRDLSCTAYGNRYQYNIGEWNEETEADCVKRGFHCAENPLDCLTYYPNFNNARYFIVEAAGDIDEDDTDSKIACTKLKLLKELNLEEFVLEAVRYIVMHPGRRDDRINEDKCIYGKNGRISNGFAIVYGKNPTFKGPIGTVIGMVQQEKDGRIIAAGVTKVRTDKMYYRIRNGRIKEEVGKDGKNITAKAI